LGLRLLAALQPFWLEPLPAIGDHRVCCRVWIGAPAKFASQEFGGVGRERLAASLAVVENGLSMVSV
jgi:hypothetical protein